MNINNSIPSPPSASIICNNLSISKTNPSNHKSINLLNSFTAQFHIGKVVGILGPSGCGKTSLLKALHQCTPTESHQLWYNSTVLTSKLANKHFAYLPQQDILPSYLTVLEYLIFCSSLYEPLLNYNQCLNGVQYLLQRLQLERCQHVRMSKISGGQQRRVSICSVLIRSGRLKDTNGRRNITALLLDEPLTGLDSSTATNVMSELRRTATAVHPKPTQMQRIVLMSLHQPTTRLFHQLDFVVILGSQQQLLFSGTRVEAETMFQPSIGTTVAEIALAVAGMTQNDVNKDNGDEHDYQQEQEHKKIETIDEETLEEGKKKYTPPSKLAYFGNHELTEDFDITVLAAKRKLQSWKTIPIINRSNIRLSTEDTTNSPMDMAPFRRQIQILSSRACMRMYRKTLLLKLHALMTCMFSFVICLLWSNINEKSDFESLHNRMGCIFFIVCFFAFSSLSGLTTFLEERALFIRERTARMYATNVYVCIEILFDIVFLRVIPPVVLGSLIYIPVGLRIEPVETFPRFILLLVLANTAFAAASLCIGAVSSKTSVATFSGGLFMLMFLAFSGVFLSLKSLPDTLAWMPYLTPSKFAYDGLIKNELVNVTFTIATGQKFFGQEMKADINGEVILGKMGFDVSRYEPISVDVVSLLMVPMMYLCITWLSVKWYHIEQR